MVHFQVHRPQEPPAKVIILIQAPDKYQIIENDTVAPPSDILPYCLHIFSHPYLARTQHHHPEVTALSPHPVLC